jgi:hypothetical protein
MGSSNFGFMFVEGNGAVLNLYQQSIGGRETVIAQYDNNMTT